MKSNRERFNDHSGGIQTHTSNSVHAYNECLHILNGDIDVIHGDIVGRKGYKLVSTVDTFQIQGMFIYRYSNVKTYVVMYDNGVNAQIVKSNAPDFSGFWTPVRILTTGHEVFLENFVGKAFIFNGFDTVKSTSDFSTYTTVTNAPSVGKFPFVLNQALHVVSEGGVLYSSDVVNATGLDFTSTVWTSRGINPNDGQKVTYALRFGGRGVIFKEESIYRYDGTNEPEATINVGTHSWRSVIVGADSKMLFHHPSGIYEMFIGNPELISFPVQKFIEGMDSENWSKVVANKSQNKDYFWIGDVTINNVLYFDYGKTYKNVVLVWNIFTRKWTVYSGLDMKHAFYDESTQRSYFGDSFGNINEINVGYSDNGKAINFEILPFPINTGYPEKIKNYGRIYMLGSLQGQGFSAGSYEELFSNNDNRSELQNGVIAMTNGIDSRQLWVAYNESYVDTPPRFSELIVENIDITDDAH